MYQNFQLSRVPRLTSLSKSLKGVIFFVAFCNLCDSDFDHQIPWMALTTIMTQLNFDLKNKNGNDMISELFGSCYIGLRDPTLK